jgi:hypothetical protein
MQPTVWTTQDITGRPEIRHPFVCCAPRNRRVTFFSFPAAARPRRLSTRQASVTARRSNTHTRFCCQCKCLFRALFFVTDSRRANVAIRSRARKQHRSEPLRSSCVVSAACGILHYGPPSELRETMLRSVRVEACCMGGALSTMHTTMLNSL